MNKPYNDPIYDIPKSEWGQGEYAREEMLNYCAHNPDPAVLYDYCIKHFNDAGLMEAAMLNPNAPAELVEQLIHHPDAGVREAAAEHPNLPVRAMEEIVMFGADFGTMMNLIHNPNLPDRLLERLAQWQDVGYPGISYDEAVALTQAAKEELERRRREQELRGEKNKYEDGTLLNNPKEEEGYDIADLINNPEIRPVYDNNDNVIVDYPVGDLHNSDLIHEIGSDEIGPGKIGFGKEEDVLYKEDDHMEDYMER